MATLEKYDWEYYHINPWWSNEHTQLTYINEPFNDPKSLARWQASGWTQTRFTGDMYDMRNPEPVWLDRFRKYFPWQHFSWSLYCMPPGVVLPEHQDTYARFKQIYEVKDSDKIYRAVVFLEDWKQGHYFDINSCPFVNWRAGDTILWKNNAPHTAANIGKENRYTLQITGLVDENIFVQ